MSPHLVHYGFLVEWNAITSLIWENSYAMEKGQKRLMVWRAGIDTGGAKYGDRGETMTEAAYDWLRQNGQGRVFATKGASASLGGHRVRSSVIDRLPGAKGSVIPGGITLFLLDTEAFKDAIAHRLRIKEGDPGRFSFHNETGTDFVSHLTAEEKRRDRHGRSSWVKIREANHLLDASMIAFAMGDPECQGGIRIIGTGQSVGRRVISKGIDLDVYDERR